MLNIVLNGLPGSVIEVLGRNYPLRRVPGDGTPQEVSARLNSVVG